jgi:hypothetical protein
MVYFRNHLRNSAVHSFSNTGLGRAMAQVVSRRSLTAEARVRARVNPCGICGGQSGTGTGFSPITSVFPCQYHSTVALRTHIIWGMRNMLWHPCLGLSHPIFRRKNTVLGVCCCCFTETSQGVNRWPLTAEARRRVRSVLGGICAGRRDTETVLRVQLRHYHSIPLIRHSDQVVCYSDQVVCCSETYSYPINMKNCFAGTR